jgi:2-polyprenyl-3-methyl-5-hydroxy-6-metoxy-1,4-benzoquinol methylase
MTPRVWTKAEIEHFLAHERLSYQKIQLPFGLETPGEAKPELCDQIFRDAAGKSVLDVGSYLGYFCQEALKRGASAAHGIEADPEKVRQARALAEMNGLAPTYSVGDIESAEVQPYDIVLLLNVLHHLFDPVGTLLRLAHVARDKLVLEVASINPRDARKLGVGFFARQMIRRLPILYVAPGVPVAKKRTLSQKYFFTPEAVRTILDRHTHLFYEVEIKRSSFKQRFVVVAKRRRIRHLIVVTGPTAAGKTTFLRQLKEGALPTDLRAWLPPGCEEWPQFAAKHLAREGARGFDGKTIDVPYLAGAVFHYDFMRPLTAAVHTYQRDQALDVLKCSDQITVIALRPEHAQLLRQFRASELESAAALKQTRRQRWHREQLLRDYESEARVASWYERWRDFIRAEYPKADYRELAPIPEAR